MYCNSWSIYNEWCMIPIRISLNDYKKCRSISEEWCMIPIRVSLNEYNYMKFVECFRKYSEAIRCITNAEFVLDIQSGLQLRIRLCIVIIIHNREEYQMLYYNITMIRSESTSWLNSIASTCPKLIELELSQNKSCMSWYWLTR